MSENEKRIAVLTIQKSREPAEADLPFHRRPKSKVNVRGGIPTPEGDITYGLYVDGDCMEARDIHDGDLIIVDHNRNPRPRSGDICLCRVDYAADAMVKEYVGPAGGRAHIVSEHRFKEKGVHFDEKGRPITEQAYFASHIYGAVIACYSPDDFEHPRWSIDASELPEVLPEKPTGESEVTYVGSATIA